MKPSSLIASLVLAASAAVLLFLLSSASANTALFARHYSWLLGANALLALGLVVWVGLRLRLFWRERRAQVFGSRLKSRLLLMLALMAVLPGALVYGVSLQFAVSSIESWFDVRVDKALEGGIDLGRGIIESQQAELLEKARNMALDLGDSSIVSATRLNRLREQSGVRSALVLSSSLQVIASSTADFGQLLPTLPNTAQLRQARQGRGLTWVEEEMENGQNGLVLHALAPLFDGGADFTVEPRYLQVTRPMSATIVASAANVEAAYRDYQELSLGRQGLNRIYGLTLTLTLLLSLSAAIALAFFLAERLARPLLILAEGTAAVAAGDFSPRAALENRDRRDELGLLIQSFNRMTQQLLEAHQETERHRNELEATSAYLESVLANLSAGVLTFDPGFRLKAANRGAVAILEDPLVDVERLPLSQWPRHAALAEAVSSAFADKGSEWQQELELQNDPAGSPKTLLLRGSTLPADGGYVVVFDDITHLLSAQRSAAWGEVARRLAHEIKNPLTPIQLSAERLQMRLADKLDGPGREMLEKSTNTIVNQVEAMKNMVNEFRDYARLPPPVLASIDVNAMVNEVLGLYETAATKVSTELAPDLPLALADANQLRQVIHNLVKNAEEALAEHAPAGGEAPRVMVSTRGEERRVVLAVSDNGPGFPAQILARAFEPYVTTKAKGTGLGLAIVRKIVDEHRGEIRLGNREGGGAEISIRLPLAA